MQVLEVALECMFLRVKMLKCIIEVWLFCVQIFKVHRVVLECMHGQKLNRSGNGVYTSSGVQSGVGVYFQVHGMAS